jgi:hypothetical protein
VSVLEYSPLVESAKIAKENFYVLRDWYCRQGCGKKALRRSRQVDQTQVGDWLQQPKQFL